MLGSRFAWISAAVLTAVLAGCAQYSQVRDVSGSKAAPANVVGEFEVFDDGKKLEWTSFTQMAFLLLPEGSSEVSLYSLGRYGRFFWALKPGDYTVLGIVVWRGTETRSTRLGLHFSVPSDGHPIYVGDLIVSLKGVRFAVEIRDLHASAQDDYRRTFPASSSELTVALMKEEEQLGHFERVSSICAKDWNLDCTKTYQGVTPIRPGGESQSKVADSLSPTFEWSAPPDASFDLVLYESIVYIRRPLGGNAASMLGRVVKYVEDLQKAKYTIDVPLRPDSSYYWSVRLRHGDQVSTWSTKSHGSFLGLGSSGSGEWFEFSTPPK